MAWAGSNPYAALSSAPASSVTQREQPAPKKNLALAKDASKVRAPAPEPAAPRAADPKKGAGNNSARPGRPEREADRKGRTYPRKSGTGRGKEQPREGKEWGEGRMGKRVEDGLAEAGREPALPASAEEQQPHVRREGRGGGGGRGGGRGGRGGGGGAREPEIAELTPEEEAALKAAKEAEERQMTLEEWNAKKAAAAPAVELKEARKVEKDAALQTPLKQTVAVDPEWGGKKTAAAQQQQKKKDGPKKEVLSLGQAPRKKREEQPGAAGGKGKRGGGGGQGGQGGGNSNNGPAINLEDASLFPSLGGGKK